MATTEPYQRSFDEQPGRSIPADDCPECDGRLKTDGGETRCTDCGLVVDACRVDDGLPTDCERPADEQYAGACKHRVAVAIRGPLLDAVRCVEATQSVAPDGGQVASADDDQMESPQNEEPEPEREDCEACLGEFPC